MIIDFVFYDSDQSETKESTLRAPIAPFKSAPPSGLRPPSRSHRRTVTVSTLPRALLRRSDESAPSDQSLQQKNRPNNHRQSASLSLNVEQVEGTVVGRSILSSSASSTNHVQEDRVEHDKKMDHADSRVRRSSIASFFQRRGGPRKSSKSVALPSAFAVARSLLF